MGATAADDSDVAAAICLAAEFLDYPTDGRATDAAKDEDRCIGLRDYGVRQAKENPDHQSAEPSRPWDRDSADHASDREATDERSDSGSARGTVKRRPFGVPAADGCVAVVTLPVC